jgi:hypothetical protein
LGILDVKIKIINNTDMWHWINIYGPYKEVVEITLKAKDEILYEIDDRMFSLPKLKLWAHRKDDIFINDIFLINYFHRNIQMIINESGYEIKYE